MYENNHDRYRLERSIPELRIHIIVSQILSENRSNQLTTTCGVVFVIPSLFNIAVSSSRIYIASNDLKVENNEIERIRKESKAP
jgi:hypothetical protein